MPNKKLTMKEVTAKIEAALSHHYGRTPAEATDKQMYDAVAISVRDQLLDKRRESRTKSKEQKPKKMYYLCMEFLLGRSLKNNLYNLGLTETYDKVLKKMGFDLEELYENESDAGLGNGGLGRLAACFMDSLASMSYPSMGYTIRYEYGLFRQKIVDGWQVELPDIWLPGGEVWLTPRHDRIYEVKFGGRVEEFWENGNCRVEYYDYDAVEAVPYDMMISGNGNNAVAALRTWKPRQESRFDMDMFSNGNYMMAVQKSVDADLIGKVLYPSDNTMEGKSLRLQQQYFLVSASAQDIVRRHIDDFGTLDNFADKNAIHINDTHPAMIIPELMRIFMDDYGFDWDKAFHVVKEAVSYTNHTVLAEALEVWPEELIAHLVPRIHQILKELNSKFCEKVYEYHPGDWDRCDRMAILSHNMVRMANLSVIGSHMINGVSAMHSEILKHDVFKDFYEDKPEKFTNVTNGIAYRRWLCQSNPELAALMDECIGSAYRNRGSQIINFLEFQDDEAVLDRLGQIKENNKRRFADYLSRTSGVVIDPSSVFDVQVKRLHEYKRQLLNALHIISLYLKIKDNPNIDMQPQTFLFGAKAAPGYDRAKDIIRLIVSVGNEIDKDPVARKYLKVVFLENYSVTMAENIMPAADISEQISLAGKEASGTGNMKLMINGALTIGTLDGANKEMDSVLEDGSIYIFGMNEDEVKALQTKGYDPFAFYQSNDLLKRSVDYLKNDIGGYNFTDMFQYLLMGSNGMADPYMCLADFNSYAEVHERMINDFVNDKKLWNKRSLQNIAHAEYFTADKAIKIYADMIWKLHPMH
ncbi:MAG: glycogen/starch/alpha-glucan phosphorylase [Eubacterium sp.]|nr:glycogen/starch/alpha-glucan phosphorylase [Eubacterium sp.]